MVERRQEPRVAGVFDARWHALSGAAVCRLTDLSWHGCFVDVAHPPAVGDEGTLKVTLGDTLVELRGQVRHVWPRQGFGLAIDPAWPVTEPEREAMRALLNQ